MTEATVSIIRASADAGRDSSGFGLPSDLLQRARARVKVVGWLILLGIGIDVTSQTTNILLGNKDTLLPTLLAANLACMLAAAALVVAASSTKVRTSVLLNLALVVEVLLCFSISVMNPWAFYQQTGALPWLHWATPLIILFPLVVPCPPRRTLVTALIAASCTPLGLFLLQANGRIQPTLDSYMSLSLGPALGAVIAYFASRVVYGLGVEVAEARRMGSYHLEKLLGKGGMGEVWLGRHRMLARPAAVKLVRPELVNNAKGGPSEALTLRRFEREAQATAAMRSPHTVNLYDFGVTADGTFFYVMELLDGLNADALVKQYGPLPPERAVHILRQICHSLAEAHEAGLVHRDVKPANVFVCRYGREVDFIKVLDFGLVKRFGGTGSEDVTRTIEHTVCGTPAYMAPEQALGRDKDDARSDIYAVGCVAYFLLTGSAVFSGTTAFEILMHHARTIPQPPSERTELPVPAALDKLILCCLEKDPALRPQTAAELSARFASCLPTSAWSDEEAQQWWDQHRPAAPSDSALDLANPA
ncbi:MAG: serine/threonine-protein kinase [Bryobacteraceae bacterium]